MEHLSEYDNPAGIADQMLLVRILRTWDISLREIIWLLYSITSKLWQQSCRVKYLLQRVEYTLGTIWSSGDALGSTNHDGDIAVSCIGRYNFPTMTYKFLYTPIGVPWPYWDSLGPGILNPIKLSRFNIARNWQIVLQNLTRRSFVISCTACTKCRKNDFVQERIDTFPNLGNSLVVP